MTRPIVAVAGIAFDDDGRVLVVQRGRNPGRGLWTVPGGKVEWGEGLAEACQRELREETGLEVEVVELCYVAERMAEDYHFVILDYLCRVTGGSLTPASDVSDALYVSAAELAELPTTDGLLDAIDAARRLQPGQSHPSSEPSP